MIEMMIFPIAVPSAITRVFSGITEAGMLGDERTPAERCIALSKQTVSRLFGT